MPSPSSSRASVAVLALALAAFVALAWWQSDAFMVWDEETMVHSVPAPRVLATASGPDAPPRFEPSCAGPHAPTFVLSSGRPRLGLCARGRLWPLMIAPYFTGVFYWPFGLLAPLHHDNVLVLRKLALLLGVASLLLTHRLVRRFADTRTAAIVALATAVSPCFVFLHAVLVHFETLPWLWVAAALLVLAAPPTPRRLAAGALLLGLAVLANLKTVVLLGPLAAVAWRLGARPPRLRASQWAAVLAAGLLPLLPMVVTYLLPSQGYGDKSSGWASALLAHLLYPERLLPSARDMVLWCSNIAYYFRGFVAHARLNVAALVLAALATAYVVADAARTLYRREGDVVTAACGAVLVAYVLMVALLYDDFPANYTPLHAVLGVSLGLAAARVHRLAARVHRLAALPVVVALLAPFAWSSAQTVRTSREFFLRTNLRTERALVAHLRANPDPRADVLVVDPRLAGVVESLSDGAVPTIQGGNYLQGCRAREGNTADAQACLQGRWRALLPLTGRAWRVMIPLDAARWHSQQVSLEPSLLVAARALGYNLERERVFDTAGSLPALALYRVTPPTGRPEDPPPREAVVAATIPGAMVFIPGGTFHMGSNDGFFAEERPVHAVTVASFYLDRTEVTVAAYSDCVRRGACTPAATTADWPDIFPPERPFANSLCNGDRPDRQNHPANCLNWPQAVAYCRFRGRRLPTEEEWEYAARGGAEERRFAWGNAPPTPGWMNACGTECAEAMLRVRAWAPLYPASDGWVGTAPVGRFPLGDGRWGVLDIAGNVQEWLATPYCPYDQPGCATDHRCVRGPGYLGNLDFKERAARRNHDVEWHRSGDLGVRCARTP